MSGAIGDPLSITGTCPEGSTYVSWFWGATFGGRSYSWIFPDPERLDGVIVDPATNTFSGEAAVPATGTIFGPFTGPSPFPPLGPGQPYDYATWGGYPPGSPAIYSIHVLCHQGDTEFTFTPTIFDFTIAGVTSPTIPPTETTEPETTEPETTEPETVQPETVPAAPARAAPRFTG